MRLHHDALQFETARLVRFWVVMKAEPFGLEGTGDVGVGARQQPFLLVLEMVVLEIVVLKMVAPDLWDTVERVWHWCVSAVAFFHRRVGYGTVQVGYVFNELVVSTAYVS